MTTQREQFEAWASKKYGRHLPTERDEHGYFDLRTDAAWLAWQEAERQMIERCAALCEAKAKEWYARSPRAQHHQGGATGAICCAEAIRALGAEDE